MTPKTHFIHSKPLACVISAALLSWSAFSIVGCEKKGDERSEPAKKTEKKADGEQKTPEEQVDGGGTKSEPVTKKGLLKDPSSPTGLEECDDYLETVCRCAKKHDALAVTCKQVKKSAPHWKKNAAADPEVLDTVRKDCRRALKALKETYGCE
jgi:hypothetical protein